MSNPAVKQALLDAWQTAVTLATPDATVKAAMELVRSTNTLARDVEATAYFDSTASLAAMLPTDPLRAALVISIAGLIATDATGASGQPLSYFIQYEQAITYFADLDQKEKDRDAMKAAYDQYLMLYVVAGDTINDFTTSLAMGLTSTIDEVINLARSDFLDVYEEPLIGTVFQVALDINGLLAKHSVFGPDDEDSVTGTSTKIDEAALLAFELELKQTWASGVSLDNVTLAKQFKAFLADFFDHDKEANDISLGSAFGTNEGALVHLSNAKIEVQLNADVDEVTQAVIQPRFDSLVYGPSGVFDTTSGGPVLLTSLSQHLLSVRQLLEVLEAFSALGTATSVSRMVVGVGGRYEYALKTGDSIIGDTWIIDKDTNKSEHKRKVKVQLIQS